MILAVDKLLATPFTLGKEGPDSVTRFICEAEARHNWIMNREEFKQGCGSNSCSSQISKGVSNFLKHFHDVSIASYFIISHCFILFHKKQRNWMGLILIMVLVWWSTHYAIAFCCYVVVLISYEYIDIFYSI